jgi:hypothetical protein
METMSSHDEFHEASHEIPSHEMSSHDVHAVPAHDVHAVVPADVPVPTNGAHTHADGTAAAEARGILDGIAESLRTLAGRDGHDGTSVAIFPRGVDVLEVRMHISRDQDVDVNLRVAGPTHAN